eukprot:6083390-Pyramimonas_sp.AAC.1
MHGSAKALGGPSSSAELLEVPGRPNVVVHASSPWDYIPRPGRPAASGSRRAAGVAGASLGAIGSTPCEMLKKSW